MVHPLPQARRPPSSQEVVVDDGEPMETARHRQQMEMLINSIELSWSDRTDFYVGGNMFVYFSETQVRRNDFRGPDFFAVLGTTHRERRAWVVWEEGGKTPDVVVELLSESTEHVARNEKMRLYARALKVGEYFLFDPLSGVFEGYELDLLEGAYRRKLAGADGRLPCRQMGLWLGKAHGAYYGVEAEWLRWSDAEGRLLPHSDEHARFATERANAAIEQAHAVSERADAESERADAESERADAESERANAESERANAESERANAESERANRLAAELLALKEKLRS